MITLTPLKEFALPITAECINPDVLRGKDCNEIGALQIWEGNKQKSIRDLFKIEQAKLESDVITINGDVSRVRQIGKAMTGGEIVIAGNAGLHLGEEMSGGKITVHGSVGGWVGSLMKGGTIEIHGDAGDYLAAPYRGSTEGMHGGSITIHGNVGNEAGAHMKQGIIKIYGNVGQFAGFRMRDGTIYVKKNCAGRAGACIAGGKIIIGGFTESVLPTFSIDSIKPKVKVEEETVQGPFYVFLGDLVENGNGKLYVSKEKNPQLGHYERLL